MEKNQKNVGMLAIFSVASVWFGSHAGGGFATGNQATQYFIQYGWYAPFMSIAAMALLGLVLREIVIMTNNHGFHNYKQVFEELYHPYVKLEYLFEIFFYIVALSATGAAIAGAATLFTQMGVPYGVAVIGVGLLLLVLTIFGANLVAKASTVMSVCILVCCAIIFYLGIAVKTPEITTAIVQQKTSGSLIQPILKVCSYAGFQVLCAPALIGCASILKTRKDAGRAMFIGFLMNAFALGASCFMLLGWYQSYTGAGELSLPTLYICNQLGKPYLYYCYTIALFLCFVSTGVTSIFGLVPRFEGICVFQKMENKKKVRIIISFTALVVSMAISMLGLSNIVKYAYVYSGYLSMIVVVIPMLTIGRAKNRKFLKEHPEAATILTMHTLKKKKGIRKGISSKAD